MHISIISGSTRTGRTSHRVALALNIALQQHGAACTIIDLQEVQLPPFTERLQFLENPPAILQQTADRLRQTKALIFVTPEYNGGITGALKNFIDVFGKAEFAGKPIGVATASAGIMGGVRAAYQLQQTILALQAYPQPQMLLAAEVTKQLDETGVVINPAFSAKLDMFVNSFITFAGKF
jgi:NAD(P)H-dependent FMN reductase